MGDTYLHFTPEDPELLPEPIAVEAAWEFIKAQFEPEEITQSSSKKPQLIIGGEIEHILICPLTGENQSEYFFEAFSELSTPDGFDMIVKSPCGTTDVNLADIEFSFEEGPEKPPLQTGGFACFEIECRNPSRMPSEDDIKEISNRLLTPSRVIFTFL